jgi:hypothetical protein
MGRRWYVSVFGLCPFSHGLYDQGSAIVPNIMNWVEGHGLGLL